MPVELCALCGRAIPYFSHAASEADQEASVFDTLADGRAACATCLDGPPLKIGSLFTGIAGLEMGILMEEPTAEVEWQAECDPHALAVLEYHFPEVDRYTDVRDIDASATRVDVVCGGFPCQPHSLAGKRRGTSDARWLWPEFARIVGDLCPSIVFIENVPGLRTSGLSVVLADLAALGFDAVWDVFSAAEVGAPHLRKRVFILAYANGEHCGLQPRWSSGAGRADSAIVAHDGADGSVADAHGKGQLQQGRSIVEEWRRAGDGCSNVAHASGAGLEGRPSAEAARSALGVAACADWWRTEPDVGRVADGVTARAHRLRLLGNAVVPAQAALAWRTLKGRVASSARPREVAA